MSPLIEMGNLSLISLWMMNYLERECVLPCLLYLRRLSPHILWSHSWIWCCIPLVCKISTPLLSHITWYPYFPAWVWKLCLHFPLIWSRYPKSLTYLSYLWLTTLQCILHIVWFWFGVPSLNTLPHKMFVCWTYIQK